MAKKEEVKAAKFNIGNLAKDLGIIAASVRVQLRNKKVKKRADGVYGWDNRADYDKVLGLWDKKDKKKAAAAPKKKAVAAKKKSAKAEPAQAAA